MATRGSPFFPSRKDLATLDGCLQFGVLTSCAPLSCRSCDRGKHLSPQESANGCSWQSSCWPCQQSLAHAHVHQAPQQVQAEPRARVERRRTAVRRIWEARRVVAALRIAAALRDRVARLPRAEGAAPVASPVVVPQVAELQVVVPTAAVQVARVAPLPRVASRVQAAPRPLMPPWTHLWTQGRLPSSMRSIRPIK